MEEGITFDNIDSSPPIETDPDGNAVTPPLPEEKSTGASSYIADERGDTEGKVKGKPDEPKSEPKAKKGAEEKIEKILKFGDQDWNLEELVKSDEDVAKFAQALKESELRRADYSRKTADLAEARKVFDADQDKYVGDVTSYLEGMNEKMNQTPLLFLQEVFEAGMDGTKRTNEEREKLVGEWIRKLTGEIKMGPEYNPRQLKRQYDLEEKVNTLQSDLQTRDESESQQQEAHEMNVLKDYLLAKAAPEFEEDSTLGIFSNKIPTFRDMVVESVLGQFQEHFNNSYDENDPSWDDNSFIDSYDFKDVWSGIEQQFEEVFKEAYDAYISRKRKSGSGRTAVSGTSGKSPAAEMDKKVTFEDIFKM